MKVAPVSERLVASAYTRSGKMLLAVLNDTDQVQQLSVALDLEKLGVKAGMTGQDVFNPGRSWKLSSVWKEKLQPKQK